MFYIPGYDPFPPRRYRELYRREAARQAQISGWRIAVAASGGQGWRAEAQVEGRAVETGFEVLVWSDLVRASMRQGIAATYLQLARTAWIYLRSGALWRLARLRLRLQDRPGALFHVMKVFADEGANIVEIYHQRIFTTLPAKGLITDIECETRDRAPLETLIAALRQAGYQVTQVELA